VPHDKIIANPCVLMHNVCYPQKYLTLDEKYTNLLKEETLPEEFSEIIKIIRSVSFMHKKLY